MELINRIGDYAGLAALLGLAVLAFLNFAHARDLRRLREWAGGAPERDAELTEATSGLASQRASELQRIAEEQRRREEAIKAEHAAHSMREKRRLRRERGLPEESRWERFRGRFEGGPGSGRFARARYGAMIAAAVIILGGGVAVGATLLLGGDDSGDGDGSPALSPASVEVAVFNGTNVEGLADRFSDRVKSLGYGVGAVTNSPSILAQSVVMFETGYKPEAEMLAQGLKIDQVQPTSREIRRSAAGARVAVIVGEDRTTAAG